ncbi:MAG: endonuclease domain-containing protein [Proteobacteria bacterium]|nr:endonuclease domain-containing protein [Pseudomonadota bacterium]
MTSRPIDERVARARSLRQIPTDAEQKFWQPSRKLPLGSSHVRRQATIRPCFADFAYHTTRIVIEIDGGPHADSSADILRTKYLTAEGYRVLRFWNNDVLHNIDGVRETIASAFRASPPTPDPSPPQARRKGN